jgi:RHS repeat-associated protein
MGGRQARRTGMKRLMLLGLSIALLASPTRAQDVVEYYHQDAIGNVRAVTNQAGQVIERHDYLPFGEEWCGTHVCGSAAPGAPKRFTGKERDAETGLDYFGARYYSARLGRFTTVDPVYTWRENLVDPQRWNRYAYGRNNALRYIDPDGKQVAEALRQLGQQIETWPDQRAVAIGGTLIIVAANIDKLADVGKAIVESGALSGIQPGYPGVDIGMDRKMSGYLFDKDQGGNTGSTLNPGPHAGGSIPARGPQRDFKPGERADINGIGESEGCHTCGKTTSGTKSGNFVPDHQPPTAVNRTNAPQRLYPQCIDCSRKQGGEVSAAVRKEKE